MNLHGTVVSASRLEVRTAQAALVQFLQVDSSGTGATALTYSKTQKLESGSGKFFSVLTSAKDKI